MHATVRRRRASPAVRLDRVAPAPSTRRVAVALAVWAAWYAAYRFYYAFGGHLGMIGDPAPAAHFGRDNFVGGAIILLAALLPSIAVSAWRHRPVRRVVTVVGWIAAVGCCMHGLTLVTLRVLSLTGVHPTHYPQGCGCPSTTARPTCRISCSTNRGSSSRAASGRSSPSPRCSPRHGSDGDAPPLSRARSRPRSAC
jgi:hypothetical protein